MSGPLHTVDSITAHVQHGGGEIVIHFDPPALLADARAAADAVVAVFEQEAGR